MCKGRKTCTASTRIPAVHDGATATICQWYKVCNGTIRSIRSTGRCTADTDTSTVPTRTVYPNSIRTISTNCDVCAAGREPNRDGHAGLADDARAICRVAFFRCLAADLFSQAETRRGYLPPLYVCAWTRRRPPLRDASSSRVASSGADDYR